MAILTPASGDRHLVALTGTINRSAQLPNTLMCWLNVQSWTTPAVISMVGVYTGVATSTSAVQIGSRGSTLSVWTWGGGVLVDAPVAPSTNEWIHVTYTYDGTNNRLYVNGVLLDTTTTAQLAGTLSTVYINGYPGGAASETGTYQVEDVSFFTRQLSAQEILTAYSSHGGRDGIAWQEVAAYLLDEQTPGAVVTACADITGNGNTLSVTGAAGTNFVYAASFVASDTRPPI